MSEELKSAREFAEQVCNTVYVPGVGMVALNLIAVTDLILSRDKLIEEAARQPLIEALQHVLAIAHFTNLDSVGYGDKSTRTIIEEALRPAASTSSDSGSRCPECGGEITHKGGHGSWCPNICCKWGWETEMDGSPLKPPVLFCATCRKPIEGKYATIGGNWVPPIAPKSYHLGCIPPLKAAAEEQQATINHKLDKLSIEAEPLIPGLWSSRPAIPWPYRIEGL